MTEGNSKDVIRRALRSVGYDIRRIRSVSSRLEPSLEDSPIWKQVSPFTMTSPERVKVLVDSISYVVDNGIHGDVVECGVWRGGSAMAMAIQLLERKESTRRIWMYDTFCGMTEPTEVDVDVAGRKASDLMRVSPRAEDPKNIWCDSSLHEVTSNMLLTRYPVENLKYVVGDVLQTLAVHVPEEISILRLDTDFYESTLMELQVLYPRLAVGGVLIIDDYGYWRGSKQATDEYLGSLTRKPLLVRVDDDCRIAIKI